MDGRLLCSGSSTLMTVGLLELMPSLWVQFGENCLSSSEPLPDSAAILDFRDVKVDPRLMVGPLAPCTRGTMWLASHGLFPVGRVVGSSPLHIKLTDRATDVCANSILQFMVRYRYELALFTAGYTTSMGMRSMLAAAKNTFIEL